MRLDDTYSFQVINKTVQAVIPALIKVFLKICLFYLLFDIFEAFECLLSIRASKIWTNLKSIVLNLSSGNHLESVKICIEMHQSRLEHLGNYMAMTLQPDTISYHSGGEFYTVLYSYFLYKMGKKLTVTTLYFDSCSSTGPWGWKFPVWGAYGDCGITYCACVCWCPASCAWAQTLTHSQPADEHTGAVSLPLGPDAAPVQAACHTNIHQCNWGWKGIESFMHVF